MSSHQTSPDAKHAATDALAHRTQAIQPPITTPLIVPPSLAVIAAQRTVRGRGNGPVLQTALLQLQRMYGNRAAARWLRATTPTPPGSSGPPVVQRMVEPGKAKPGDQVFVTFGD